MEELRINANVGSLEHVQTAYKERSGEVGVVTRPTAPQILEVDVKDGVQTIRLEVSTGG